MDERIWVWLRLRLWLRNWNWNWHCSLCGHPMMVIPHLEEGPERTGTALTALTTSGTQLSSFRTSSGWPREPSEG
jgi:hypothetical protein